MTETHMNASAIRGGILKTKRIRVTALGIFRRGDCILVTEGDDPIKGERFYRPLGGAIEFGERGDEAVAREMVEETGLAVRNLRYMGICESIFTYLGELGHEIVLVYSGDFVDSAAYDVEYLECHEEEDMPFRAVWKRPDEFGADKDGPLYPDGLMEMLVDDGYVQSVGREE